MVIENLDGTLRQAFDETTKAYARTTFCGGWNNASASLR